MTRDYAKKPRPPVRRPGYQSRVPAWVWLFTGSVLGAFIMFLVYLTGITPQPTQFPDLTLNTTADASENAAPKPETGEIDEPPATPKPRFDFYQLLKESEVAKVESPTATTPVNGSEQLNRPDTGPHFDLQVGSFRNHDDADRLRADLILMNLEARIETVTVRNAETWHRVLVGPFSTKTQLAKARGTLAANSIDSLVLRATEAKHGG